MRLRTELEIPVSSWKIGHGSRVVMVGSCFSERMASRMQALKFEVYSNPFGILYHPVPLVAPLVAALRGQNPFGDEVFWRDGRWRSLAFHSSFSHVDEEGFLGMIAARLGEVRARLVGADVVVLTLGSAVGHQVRANGMWAGNCHRLAGGLFERRTGSLEEMEGAMRLFLAELRAVNPRVRVILTVSPVRHLRSGLLEDSLGKALLRVVCQRLEGVDYFPAFELLNDDLRDYRFYGEDMAHPSEQAVGYVWDRFAGCYFGAETMGLVREIEGVLRDLGHRGDERDVEYQAHLEGVREKVRVLGERVDMREEMAFLEGKLKSGE